MGIASKRTAGPGTVAAGVLSRGNTPQPPRCAQRESNGPGTVGYYQALSAATLTLAAMAGFRRNLTTAASLRTVALQLSCSS